LSQDFADRKLLLACSGQQSGELPPGPDMIPLQKELENKGVLEAPFKRIGLHSNAKVQPNLQFVQAKRHFK